MITLLQILIHNNFKILRQIINQIKIKTVITKITKLNQIILLNQQLVKNNKTRILIKKIKL